MNKTFTIFSPKTAFYFANGTGRDTYISVNNGGMTMPHKLYPELSIFTNS